MTCEALRPIATISHWSIGQMVGGACVCVSGSREHSHWLKKCTIVQFHLIHFTLSFPLKCSFNVLVIASHFPLLDKLINDHRPCIRQPVNQSETCLDSVSLKSKISDQPISIGLVFHSIDDDANTRNDGISKGSVRSDVAKGNDIGTRKSIDIPASSSASDAAIVSDSGCYRCGEQGCAFSHSNRLYVLAHHKEQHENEMWKCPGCDYLLSPGAFERIGIHVINCEKSPPLIIDDSTHGAISFEMRDDKYPCPFDDCPRQLPSRNKCIKHWINYHRALSWLCQACNAAIVASGYCIGAHILTCQKNGGGHGSWVKRLLLRKDVNLEGTSNQLSTPLHPISNMYRLERGRYHCSYEPHCDFSSNSKNRFDVIAHYKAAHLKEWWKCTGCHGIYNPNPCRRIGAHVFNCPSSPPTLIETVSGKQIVFENSKKQRFHCPFNACSHRSRWKNWIIEHYSSYHVPLSWVCIACSNRIPANHYAIGSHLFICKNSKSEFWVKNCSTNQEKQQAQQPPQEANKQQAQQPPQEANKPPEQSNKNKDNRRRCGRQKRSTSHTVTNTDDNSTQYIRLESFEFVDGRYQCIFPGCHVSSPNRIYVFSHYRRNHLGQRWKCAHCHQPVSPHSLGQHVLKCNESLRRMETRPGTSDMKDMKWVCTGCHAQLRKCSQSLISVHILNCIKNGGGQWLKDSRPTSNPPSVLDLVSTSDDDDDDDGS